MTPIRRRGAMGNLLIEHVKELEREIAAANHAYFLVADPIWEKSCCMKDGLSVCKRSRKSLLLCFDDPLCSSPTYPFRRLCPDRRRLAHPLHRRDTKEAPPDLHPPDA